MSLAMVTIFSYFYFNFIGTLSQNVVPVTAEGKNVIKFFFPQGWGFFTKNPRDAKYKLYKLEGDSPQLVNYKITSPKNLFGASRKGNRVCIEMIRLQNLLPKAPQWEASTVDIDEYDYSQKDFEILDINNEEYFYIKSGKYIIKEYFITPWNWLKYPENYSGEYKYHFFELK